MERDFVAESTKNAPKASVESTAIQQRLAAAKVDENREKTTKMRGARTAKISETKGARKLNVGGRKGKGKGVVADGAFGPPVAEVASADAPVGAVAL